jgi:hypothetical protein
MPNIPYTCTNDESQGRAIIYKDGAYLNLISASRCFAEYLCAVNGWTWDWENGVDPDDPSTWPLPELPPVTPQESTTPPA